MKQQTQATSHIAFKIFLLAFSVAICLKEGISTIAIPILFCLAALEEMKRATSLLDVASSAPHGEAPADAGKSAQEGGGEAGSGSHLTRKCGSGGAGGLMLTQHGAFDCEEPGIALVGTTGYRLA